MARTPEPRAHIRSVRVTDRKGHHWDIEGNDLTWGNDLVQLNLWVHIRSGEATLASISDPAQVIALDWEVK